MRKNPVLVGFIIIVGLLLLFGVGIVGTLYGIFGERPLSISSNSVLVIEIKGIITDSRHFLKDIRKYVDNSDVRAIVIRIDSPGGVVGPSQEMHHALLRLREEGKKVVASLGSVAASGGYYIAVGAEKIVANPGTITGSIGVIMEFADISRLYDWAKISRYVIKTGKYKDTGAEYRAMTQDEKEVMQVTINNVFDQFKKAVAEGRNLPPKKVSELADGRIFSGEQAVKSGLADQVGGIQDAIDLAAKLAGIEGKPEPLYIPKHRGRFLEMFFNPVEEEEARLSRFAQKVLGTEFVGQPLYIMPGVLRW